MKVYRDTETNEMFLGLDDNIRMVSLSSSRLYSIEGFNLEEIDPTPKELTLKHDRVVEDSFSVGRMKKTKFHLKDVVYVPVDGKDIAFRVEHIENGKVYFVAVDCVGNSSMNDMDDFLENFQKKMPKQLVDIMCDIEHTVDNKTESNKIMLLSHANLVKNDRCTGKDDILFDGLQTEAERCKNLDGETQWYYTDTPFAGGSTYFVYVGSYGNPGNGGSAPDAFGVVPCFSIQLLSD